MNQKYVIMALLIINNFYQDILLSNSIKFIGIIDTIFTDFNNDSKLLFFCK